MKTFTSTKTMIFFQDDQIMIILIGNFLFCIWAETDKQEACHFRHGKVICFKLVMLFV